MKLSRRLSAVVVTALAVSAWVTTSPARADTPVAPIVSPSSVSPGDPFTVSGGYCDGVVTVTIAGLGLGDTIDGGTPPWVLHFTTPVDAKPGVYTVVSACEYFDFPDTTVTVTSTAPTSTSTSTTSTSTTSTLAATTTTAAVKAEAVPATANFTG